MLIRLQLSNCPTVQCVIVTAGTIGIDYTGWSIVHVIAADQSFRPSKVCKRWSAALAFALPLCRSSRTFSSLASLAFSCPAPHLLFCWLSCLLISCPAPSLLLPLLFSPLLPLLSLLPLLPCTFAFSVSRTFASLASCLLSFHFPFHVVDGCPFLSFQLYDATHLFNASFRSPNMFTTAVIFSFVSLIALMAKRHEAPMNMYLLAAFTCCEAYTLGV